MNELDRLLNEIEEEAIANGQELSWFETMSAMYSRIFGEAVPLFEYDLLDDVKGNVLLECLTYKQKISTMSEVEFLQLQYQAMFGEDLTYNFMTIYTEEELLTALRESLKSGKPYELPDDVKQLIEQGANF